jgi:hypothetical protein
VYSIEVLGLASNQSKVHFARVERVRAALRLLDDPDAREAVTEAIGFAERAVHALRTALQTYARYSLSAGTRKPQGRDVSTLIRSLGAEPRAWSALGAEFDAFLRALEADITEAGRRFQGRGLTIIRERFHQAVSGADASGRGLQARARAERRLNQELWALTSSGGTESPPASDRSVNAQEVGSE